MQSPSPCSQGAPKVGSIKRLLSGMSGVVNVQDTLTHSPTAIEGIFAPIALPLSIHFPLDAFMRTEKPPRSDSRPRASLTFAHALTL